MLRRRAAVFVDDGINALSAAPPRVAEREEPEEEDEQDAAAPRAARQEGREVIRYRQIRLETRERTGERLFLRSEKKVELIQHYFFALSLSLSLSL